MELQCICKRRLKIELWVYEKRSGIKKVESVKLIFARKKRPWKIHWMLRCIRIKHDVKGSRVKRGRNLKGYKVRGVFQRSKKQGGEKSS